MLQTWQALSNSLLQQAWKLHCAKTKKGDFRGIKFQSKLPMYRASHSRVLANVWRARNADRSREVWYEFHENSKCTLKLTFPWLSLLLTFRIFRAHIFPIPQNTSARKYAHLRSRCYANALFVLRLNLLFRAQPESFAGNIISGRRLA